MVKIYQNNLNYTYNISLVISLSLGDHNCFHLVFQWFDFDRTLSSSFQECVVRTSLDIYFFIRTFSYTLFDWLIDWLLLKDIQAVFSDIFRTRTCSIIYIYIKLSMLIVRLRHPLWISKKSRRIVATTKD
jgi:hypothetical protein